MQRYIITRLGHACLALIAISIIVFALTRLSGNPIDVLLPEEAEPEDIQRVKEVWGLDKPLHVQYLVYLGNIATGNLGESIKWPGRGAAELIASRLPATLQLASFALVVAGIIALPIGVMVAVKKDTGIDYAGKVVALLGQSLPSFWLGIVLMWIFAVMLGWVPTSGRSGITSFILPAVALGYFQVAAIMRLTRSSMLEVLDTEYVKLARIKGIPERKVIWKHSLRNAAIAPLTYFGLILGGFMTGSVVIETVFAWPGLGRLAVESVNNIDYPLLQGVVITFTLLYSVASLLVDVAYAYIDPRIRYS
jgi:peptide/nickel transport system permease protein